ncbi:hypothetical protein ACRRTK_021256 [Alexandromys fortis]
MRAAGCWGRSPAAPISTVNKEARSSKVNSTHDECDPALQVAQNSANYQPHLLPVSRVKSSLFISSLKRQPFVFNIPGST